MGLLYSISFLLGNFSGTGRLIHFLIGIKNRKNREKNINWLAIVSLVWIHLAPAVVLFFIYQPQLSWIQHVLILVASLVVGFKWTGSWAQTTDELEKVILGEHEIRRNEKTSIEQIWRNSLAGIVKYFREIYARMFPYKVWLKSYIRFRTREEDDRAVKILQELCQEIDISNVILCVFPGDHTQGYAILKPRFKKGLSFVVISSFASEKLSYDELRALIAHELMHIHNKDYYSNNSLFSMGTIFCFIFGTMLYASLIDLFLRIVPLIALFLVIILPVLLIAFIFVVLYFLQSKHGYWFQIRELRADRKSCKLSGNMREGMLKLLERLKVEEVAEDSNTMWFQKYYLRYNRWHFHPSIEYRIKKIQEYQEWSYKDYFKLFFQTIKWVLTGKGWSGS
ncbi:heat shock protein HtpX [Paenibacillus cellulosilyticus]|uniref:Heat shock protein HtpX n=1 Tax=Paenibacillus cellulosilyticus TaxID=375489 RepID=A0A2V2YWC0_9BACL|nr:M48 family metalloprotease [Paenibacillus cellulosilyticus]PWW06108.1 heat shock protein HtpX [Paenibacillus cellulosilyticus]QKS43117.1 M48 family metalloprotease [Paenibacillus cellulosilyticus]